MSTAPSPASPMGPDVAPDLLNLRDVGGLRTIDGRTVRPGVLLRCATPAFVDDEQVARLVDELGVATRVDLRSEKEAVEATSAAFDAVAVEHLEVHAGEARKDRTGTAVALTLAAVGVHEDDVVADYARTEQAMPLLREQFTRLPSYQERLAALPAEAFGSTPETMRRFLRLVEQTYGGARAYLRAHGLTDAELAGLERHLLGE